MSLNMFAVSGNIATDIDLRYTHGKGIAVATFRLAVSHGKDRPSSFFNAVVWDTGAERIAREFKKGDSIALTGYLMEETWEDKVTGKPRSRVILRAERHERIDRTRHVVAEASDVEGVMEAVEARHS